MTEQVMKTMGQSKLNSFIESTINVLIGFIIALLAQMIVFPLYGIETSFESNFQIASIFTIVSIVRGYFFRRFFNWIETVKK